MAGVCSRSGELESCRRKWQGEVGVSDIASVLAHTREYGSQGHAQFEDTGGKAFSLILSFSS